MEDNVQFFYLGNLVFQCQAMQGCHNLEFHDFNKFLKQETFIF